MRKAGSITARGNNRRRMLRPWIDTCRRCREPTRGSVRIPGILQNVDVQVDTFGVPYVTAGHETDMLRALGYLHATDRLWQMEFFRRVAAGRLAELFGRDQVPTDRLLRTLDLWGAAEHAVANLDPDELERLQANYAGEVTMCDRWFGHFMEALKLSGRLDDTVVAPNGEVNVNDEIDYTVTVENTGNVDLTNVVLGDVFAGGATLVSGDINTRGNPK